MASTPQRVGRLEGEVAVVTGAASGIGRASALRFAAEGAAVLVVDRDEAGADAVAGEIGTGGGRAAAMAVDLAVPGAPAAVAERAAEGLGGLHVLLNNAGVHGEGEGPQERWDDCLATNLRAPYLLCLAALPHMRAAGAGSIVNTASISGPVVGFASPHYDASKAGLVGLTRHLASLWGQHGIRVNAVCPGFIQTRFIGSKWTPDRVEALHRDIALGRVGRAEEIASVALFLASDESSYVTGAAIVADGGWTMHYAKY